MPNWCEGNIRFRGKFDDIVKLIKEQFVCFEMIPRTDTFSERVEHSPEVTVGDIWDGIYVKAPQNCTGSSGFWIRDSRRQFVGRYDDEVVGTAISVDENTRDCIIIFDDFSAAWSIDHIPYDEIAQKYNVDIRIVGYECGMQFRQVVEIDRSGTVNEEVSEYKKWAWESDFPKMGG